jgi:hypothetical protein
VSDKPRAHWGVGKGVVYVRQLHGMLLVGNMGNGEGTYFGPDRQEIDVIRLS